MRFGGKTHYSGVPAVPYLSPRQNIAPNEPHVGSDSARLLARHDLDQEPDDVEPVSGRYSCPMYFLQQFTQETADAVDEDTKMMSILTIGLGDGAQELQL